MVHIVWRKPSDEKLQQILHSSSEPNHALVNATFDAPPPPAEVSEHGSGWVVDHHRVQIGVGRRTYARAVAAVKRWAHFQLGWAEVDERVRVRAGEKVAVMANPLHLPRPIDIWVAMPLRIVYAIEDVVRRSTPASSHTTASKLAGGRVRRFMFAHTTLRGHFLAGEERFAVEHHDADDSVWFEIYTISRPAHPLAVACYPLTRWCQRKFARDSSRTMLHIMQLTDDAAQ